MRASGDRAARYPLGAAVTFTELERDPHPLLARLRRHEPVSWLPALDGWLVTSRGQALEVLRAPELFTVDDPRFSTRQVIGPSMLSLDGSEHERHRAPFNDPFRHGTVVGQFGAWTAGRARRLVAAIAPRGRGELRQTIAAPLAVAVVAAALGLEDVAPSKVLAWYDAIVAAVDGVTAGDPVSTAGRAAFAELEAAVLAAAARPGTMLHTIMQPETLTAAEMVSNAAVVLFGGIVTAESATAHALLHLLRHPGQLDEVRADRSLVANAVEESLRLEPAAAVVDRYATQATELGGAAIGARELVTVSLAGANRDPATFTDPDRFDVRRPNARQHLAFARGPHACLGIHLARLETQAAVGAVLDLLAGIRLVPGETTAPHGLIFRKPDRVTAAWNAPAR